MNSQPPLLEMETALRVLRDRKVAVMVVAHNAETHIESVLKRIPPEISRHLAEIYVLDDCSNDRTLETAREAGARLGMGNLRVYRTPLNRGYGCNQKIGYTYAVRQAFDFVIMLHGDGQHAPESLPCMIAALDKGPDVVLGSRMVKRLDALRGGMPLYKWIGNQLLTSFENKILGMHLSELHTGYRAYRVAAMARIPFRYNNDNFHFDTQILIQFLSAGATIAEVPVPTCYGNEKCHVSGLRYAWACVKSVLKYRLFTMGLFYDPFLDFNLFGTESYFFKKASNTLHQNVLHREYAPPATVLDFGSAAGYIAAELAKRVARVIAVDCQRPARSGQAEAMQFDLNRDFDRLFGPGRFDAVLALDVIEHMEEPEQAAAKLARIIKPGGMLLASTANVSFFLTRLMMLLGVFNYGKRGILDKTHKRLFTVYSFQHLLRTYGFAVKEVRGFGPPIRDLISTRWPFAAIASVLAWLARVWPRLFAYNFLVVAERLPALEEVYDRTIQQEPVCRQEVTHV